MAGILVQHRVKDYQNWKINYDSQAALRTSNGMLSDQVFRDAGDPNKVIVVLKWISLENAQKFAQSPELKAAMEKAGVDGQPSITFFEEV